MANLRLSTIYDYATLRLHRDGTRVQQSDENYTVPKRKKLAVRDTDGNWIAKDAGGLGMVNRTRYIRFDADEEREYVSLEGRAEEGEKADEWILLKKEPKKKQDYRTEKRREFDANLDFLDDPHTASSSLTQIQEPCLQVPSSVRDLPSQTPKHVPIHQWAGTPQIHTLLYGFVLLRQRRAPGPWKNI